MPVKVSVIVPNYNHASYLRQRLDSILNQTYQDFELILLDDASTDNSLEVLHAYKNHPKISHFIVNEKNSGSPFKQWEKGLRLAKGDYVWIAESDDYAELNFLEETLNSLKTNAGIALAYCDSRIIDEEGKTLNLISKRKNGFFKTNRWSYDAIVDGRAELLHYMFFKTTINNASAALFNKSHINDAFLIRLANYKNAGDMFCYMYYALKGNIVYISKALNNYREHGYNTTKKNIENGVLYKERLLCYLEIISMLKESKLTKTEQKKLKQSIDYAIKKNAFQLIDYKNYKVLKDFVLEVREFKLLSYPKSFILLLMFNLYKVNVKRIRGLSVRVIKLIC